MLGTTLEIVRGGAAGDIVAHDGVATFKSATVKLYQRRIVKAWCVKALSAN